MTSTVFARVSCHLLTQCLRKTGLETRSRRCRRSTRRRWTLPYRTDGTMSSGTANSRVLAFACSLRASAAMFCNTGRPDAHVDTRSDRSEEHTPELQSLMRISYAVFCLTRKNETTIKHRRTPHHIIQLAYLINDTMIE